MLEFLFKHKLFPKDMINTLICNPGHSSSGEASSSSSLPSSGKILTACIELIELNLPEITLNATKCIVCYSFLLLIIYFYSFSFFFTDFYVTVVPIT